MSGFDRAEVVEQTWPYDGPHDAESVTSAAAAVRALVRYVNNATQSGTAEYTVPYAQTVDQVLGSITSAVCGLQQLVGQLASKLEREVHNPTLYDDRFDRPGSQTATELVARLQDIADRAVPELADQLGAARRLSNHLGGTFDDQT